LEKSVVFYTNSVQLFFDELIKDLFEKEYFSFKENAINYVQKLVHYLEDNIGNLPQRKTPKSLSKYGDFYVFYKSNSRTTWYIFFSKKNSNYLIKHITNNHVFDASFVNLLNKNE
jgi:bifunctional pyridoxal-dependent enzyme with beta-cystathionase and maltose regulon repressor activities